MKFSQSIYNMAVFIEFLAGAGIAIFFHLVLHSPEIAYSIFGIGILLSLATYLIREDLEKTRQELIGQYNQAHEVTFAIAQICDAECHIKAEAMLSGVKRTIAQLQQGFIPLDETEFHLEGAKCSEQAVRRMKSVDPITNGWHTNGCHTRGAFANYYQSNLRALERGVAITRIFVMNHEELTAPDSQKILLAQHRAGIEVRIAFREELPTASSMSGRDTNSSYNFAIYDDQIATEVFPQSGTYFGRKTSQAVNVEKFLRFYELIEHSSNVIAVEEEQVTIASDILKAAA
jgi:hypothetical protein